MKRIIRYVALGQSNEKGAGLGGYQPPADPRVKVILVDGTTKTAALGEFPFNAPVSGTGEIYSSPAYFTAHALLWEAETLIASGDADYDEVEVHICPSMYGANPLDQWVTFDWMRDKHKRANHLWDGSGANPGAYAAFEAHGWDKVDLMTISVGESNAPPVVDKRKEPHPTNAVATWRTGDRLMANTVPKFQWLMDQLTYSAATFFKADVLQWRQLMAGGPNDFMNAAILSWCNPFPDLIYANVIRDEYVGQNYRDYSDQGVTTDIEVTWDVNNAGPGFGGDFSHANGDAYWARVCRGMAQALPRLNIGTMDDYSLAQAV